MKVRSSIWQHSKNTGEKDAKDHQKRRIALDAETLALLVEHRAAWQERTTGLGVEFVDDAFVFSIAPDGSKHLLPDSVSQRYGKLVRRLGITTSVPKLRYYSATELIAGVDPRTVAGRLGHGGGGTTLRFTWHGCPRSTSGPHRRWPRACPSVRPSVRSASRAPGRSGRETDRSRPVPGPRPRHRRPGRGAPLSAGAGRPRRRIWESSGSSPIVDRPGHGHARQVTAETAIEGSLTTDGAHPRRVPFGWCAREPLPSRGRRVMCR